MPAITCASFPFEERRITTTILNRVPCEIRAHSNSIDVHIILLLSHIFCIQYNIKKSSNLDQAELPKWKTDALNVYTNNPMLRSEILMLKHPH